MWTFFRGITKKAGYSLETFFFFFSYLVIWWVYTWVNFSKVWNRRHEIPEAHIVKFPVFCSTDLNKSARAGTRTHTHTHTPGFPSQTGVCELFDALGISLVLWVNPGTESSSPGVTLHLLFTLDLIISQPWTSPVYTVHSVIKVKSRKMHQTASDWTVRQSESGRIRSEKRQVGFSPVVIPAIPFSFPRLAALSSHLCLPPLLKTPLGFQVSVLSISFVKVSAATSAWSTPPPSFTSKHSGPPPFFVPSYLHPAADLPPPTSKPCA